MDPLIVDGISLKLLPINSHCILGKIYYWEESYFLVKRRKRERSAITSYIISMYVLVDIDSYIYSRVDIIVILEQINKKIINYEYARNI